MPASGGGPEKPPSMSTADNTAPDIQSPVEAHRSSAKRPHASDIQIMTNTSTAASPAAKRRAVTTSTVGAPIITAGSKDDGSAIVAQTGSCEVSDKNTMQSE